MIIAILSYSFSRDTVVEYLSKSARSLRTIMIEYPKIVVEMTKGREKYTFGLL